MTTQIILLILCCVIVMLMVIFRKTSFVKKYWRYSLILIPAILILILRIFTIAKSKSTDPSSNSSAVKDSILDIKGKLAEVNTVVQVEAAIAKTNDDQKMKQLKEIQKIPDDQERRKQLAAMIG
jgi:glucan phosphoethanolaminetransferase (alkaline phosphatase superfamily)